jgi:5-methylthioadenosine/S-adenosylhomocysteine deaminase
MRPRPRLLATGSLTVMLAAVAACGPAPDATQAPEGTAPEASTQGRGAVDLLILGGTVVTMNADRQVLMNGAVVVDEGAIVAVGPAAEIAARYDARRVIQPAPHDIVMPGIVNGHNHAAMTLLRGVADDMRLMDWLQNYIFPAESTLVDPDFVRVGTRLAALEMIRTGTTTFADMYYYEDDVAQVVNDAGLRGVLGETILDMPTPDAATVDDALAYTEQFLQNWADHPRVTAAVAPHAPYTVGPETLRKTAALARRYGAPLLIHLAESRDELEQVQGRYGSTPVQYLENIGFLGPDVLGAHAIWVNAADIATLAERGVGVVHNPESNMKLASGTMPIAALREAGVSVGLGTDGAASNNDLDMFGAMLTAALLHKQMREDPTAMPAPEVVALATIEGARALGMDGAIGSLEVGKRADLIVVDGNAASLVPRYDPYSHLVYAARGDSVEVSIVDGRILFEAGAFTTLDPRAVIDDARVAAARIREVVGRRP